MRELTRTPPSRISILGASRAGHLAEVVESLRKGGDVNSRDSKGRTPLMLATIGGHVSIIESLLQAQANPNLKDKKGRSALRIAIDLKKEAEGIHRRGQEASNRLEIIRLLLCHHADPDETDADGFTLTRHLLRKNQIDVADLLIEFGGQGSQDAELIKSIENRCTDRVRLLLEGGADPNTKQTNGDTAVIMAAERGLTDIARVLIEKGADIGAKDERGETALMHTSTFFHWIREANAEDQTNMVRLLVAKGAAVDATDKVGNTALMLAAPGMHRFDLQIVRALLDHHANIHIRNADGRNALALAVLLEGGNEEIIEALLKKGADPNSTLPTDDLCDDRDEAAGDFAGMSVLIWAAMFGRQDVVKLLLDAGANVNQRLRNGLAALHFAAFTGNIPERASDGAPLQIVKQLVSNGADLARDGVEAFALAPRNGAIRQYLAGPSCGVDPNLVEGTVIDLAALTRRTEGAISRTRSLCKYAVEGNRARFVRGEMIEQGKRR